MRLNVNMLTWHDSRSYQDYRKYWVSEIEPVIAGFDRIPAFQLSRAKTGNPITLFVIKNAHTGAEVDILANFTAAGGVVVEDDADYDVIRYPDTLPLGIAGITLGQYELEMSDGVNTWYSEIFQMCPNLGNYIKIQYWHNEPFCYPGGKFLYDAPYKSTVYLSSEIGKPTYPYEETVKKNKGYNQPLQQVSFKQFNFWVLLTEYMMDALRLVGMHDEVEIFYEGRTYIVDEFLMTDPKWTAIGDVAEMIFEFKTDTVVAISGRSVGVLPYEPDGGSCVENVYNCVGIIEDGSDNYINFQYIRSDGNLTNLEDDDYVLVSTLGGTQRVYQYNASVYTLQTVLAGEVVFCASNGIYYIGSGSNIVLQPLLQFYDHDSQAFSGTFLQGGTHLLYAVTDGVTTYLGSYTYTQLAIDGIAIPLPEGTQFARMEIASGPCGVFYTSPDFEINEPIEGEMGVGYDLIGSTLVVY